MIGAGQHYFSDKIVKKKTKPKNKETKTQLTDN